MKTIFALALVAVLGSAAPAFAQASNASLLGNYVVTGTEADGKAYRTAGNIDVAVSSGIDWFDLDVNVDFGNGAKASLPKLLKALNKGQKSIQLDDGTIGLLPEDWLSKYAVLAGLGDEQADGSLRFGKVQVGFLDAMIASLPQAKFDENYARARAELSSFSGIGQADFGGAEALPLEAIAAVVIGGTSINGGQGAIWRTVLGVALLALISNGFNLLSVAPQYQQIAWQ